MTDHATPAIPEVTDRDVYITRAFDAPRDVVWRFFTEPELLSRWFGPTSVHVDPATVKIELRPGGAWHLDMVDNETGEHYPVRATLTVVTPPEYFEGLENSNPTMGELRLRVWFHDHGEKTRITIHQGPFSAEFRDTTSTGWNESFLKIDAAIEAGAA
jgi:uncharacterized protein YndB with AHSA1/START domain